VTNQFYAQFCAEAGKAIGASAEVGKDDHPVVNVSWEEAVSFCKWAGTQLPSEEEWEKSARGTDGRAYPWGNRWEQGKCNIGTAGTTPVGAYPGDTSPYGCLDMAGNVREWTRSWGQARGPSGEKYMRTVCGGHSLSIRGEASGPSTLSRPRSENATSDFVW
jgi:formylglycine-generating enzyme required for sulfatase activity